MSSYIKFEKTESGYYVKNKRQKEILGEILFYPRWKEYVFSPYCADFSCGCLDEISTFIKQLNKEKRD